VNTLRFVFGALSRIALAVLLSSAALGGFGCRASLPTYPLMEPEESLRIIAERLDGVKTIQSSATVEFADAAGESVRVDAALAAELPDRLRLRAWKFDRAVFDATLNGEGLWLLPRESEQAAARAEDSAKAAEGVRRALSLMGPGFYQTATVEQSRTNARDLVVIGEAGGETLICVIERATLTPRRFEGGGDVASEAFLIELDGYREIGTIVWPTTWSVEYPRGRVSIRMHDVTLNDELASGAFNPPRRAVRRP